MAIRSRMIILILVISIMGCRFNISKTCISIPSEKLPKTFEERNLVGKWTIKYSASASETLVLKSDGGFQQIYEASSDPANRIQIDGEGWYIERLTDDQARLIVPTGRYFLLGREFGESNGQRGRDLFGFYDPFSKETVYMDDQLILSVVITDSGQYLLHHLWTSSDRGFVIFGCASEYFQHMETFEE